MMTDELRDDESAAYLAICNGEAEPDLDAFRAGYDAHAAGRQFHEWPEPFSSIKALSWRIGWNARALEQGP